MPENPNTVMQVRRLQKSAKSIQPALSPTQQQTIVGNTAGSSGTSFSHKILPKITPIPEDSDTWAPSGTLLSLPSNRCATDTPLSKGDSSDMSFGNDFCTLHPEVRVFRTYNDFYSFIGESVLVRANPISKLPLRYIVLEAYISPPNKKEQAVENLSAMEEPPTGSSLWASSSYGSMPSLVSSGYITPTLPTPEPFHAADIPSQYLEVGPFLPHALPLPTVIPTSIPNFQPVQEPSPNHPPQPVCKLDFSSNSKNNTKTQASTNLDLGNATLEGFGVYGSTTTLSNLVASLLENLGHQMDAQHASETVR